MKNEKWIDWRKRFPEEGKPVWCKLQHWHTKGIHYAWLIYVKEDDCSWRTADDRSEISYDWNVLCWKESKTLESEKEKILIKFLKTKKGRDTVAKAMVDPIRNLKPVISPLFEKFIKTKKGQNALKKVINEPIRKLKHVICPTFEIASCPSIKLKDIKDAIRNGTSLFDIPVTDTVTGKTSSINEKLKSLPNNYQKLCRKIYSNMQKGKK